MKIKQNIILTLLIYCGCIFSIGDVRIKQKIYWLKIF